MTQDRLPERSDDLWIVGLFASSGIAAAAFVLFLAFSPPALLGPRTIAASPSAVAQAQSGAANVRKSGGRTTGSATTAGDGGR